jgi:hypothetical protein
LQGVQRRNAIFWIDQQRAERCLLAELAQQTRRRVGRGLEHEESGVAACHRALAAVDRSQPRNGEVLRLQADFLTEQLVRAVWTAERLEGEQCKLALHFLGASRLAGSEGCEDR